MKQVSYKAYGEFFETLASETRLQIINVLRTGPKNQSQIINETKLEQSCASHCIKKLLEHGFVTAEKNGKFTVYELNHTTIEPLMTLIDDHARNHCEHIVKRKMK